MTIIEKYRELTEKIAVVKSCLTTTKREMNKLINVYRPREVGAIDYAAPAVQTSCSQEDIASVYRKIHDYGTEQQQLEAELQSLYEQRDELEKTINDLGDIKKQIVMLKIKGLSSYKIAGKFHYSVRRIQQIVSECESIEK